MRAISEIETIYNEIIGLKDKNLRKKFLEWSKVKTLSSPEIDAETCTYSSSSPSNERCGQDG